MDRGALFRLAYAGRYSHMTTSSAPVVFRLAAACAAALLSVTALSAEGAESSTTFRVLLEVAASCTVERSADVDFGLVVQSTANQVVETSGALIVRCNVTTPYSVALDKGLHGDSAGNRWMVGPGGQPLPYALYSGPAGNCSAASNIQWGDGGAGTCVLSTTNNGADQLIPVIGRATLDNPVAGSYSDTVTATLTY